MHIEFAMHSVYEKVSDQGPVWVRSEDKIPSDFISFHNINVWSDYQNIPSMSIRFRAFGLIWKENLKNGQNLLEKLIKCNAVLKSPVSDAAQKGKT